MTEHPTSSETRQSAPTAASSASPAAGAAGTAPPGGVPEPRSALQQPGGDAGDRAATAAAGPPAGQGAAEPAADHGPAGDGARAYGAARAPRDSSYGVYAGSYGGPYDPYGEVAMSAEGRPGGVPEVEPGAERAAVRTGRPVAQGAVEGAGAPEPGEEPGHAQPLPRAAGEGIGRPREGGAADGAAPRAHGGEPGAGGPPPAPPGVRGGGPPGAPGLPLPPSVPPARSAHPGESGESREAAAARQASGDRLRFIGAATRRIARGIDLDEIVLGLCRATVPTFADAILVYLRDPLPVGDERPTGPVVLRLRRTDRIPEEPDTNGLRLPVLPAQPDLGPAMGGSAAELCEVRAGGPLAEVLRGVRPLFGEAQAARTALPELLGPDTRLPGGHRVILAPLRGRRRVIGAAVFLRRPDRPAFEPDDLLVAAQLATHTALGVDKAVLYGREAYIADALQRTMLPDSLPQPTGVRLASRYLPAAETARVGGDWYDAIPLPGSRVALVVGDVMGHSMTSAAIMGQLRTTAQTLAGLDLPPQEVLHHLDEQAQRLGTDRMATCMYAVYDPVAHRITIANAGHPPPVMLHRGGRAEVLRVPSGAPIGVGGVDFEAVELDAPAGATLVLYTDGLVESRIRDVWTGIEQLRERLAETARLTGPNPPPLEPLCDEVLDMLGPGDRDDDIALLAARFDGIAPSDVAYWYLDPKAQTAGQARRLARRALARWGLDELTDQLELLVSEVVTNAVRYAERPVTLRLLRTDVLRCEVGDDVPQLPRLRNARPSDEGGRGLYLVNRMARRWGATRLSMGKVVWFELSMPPGARR
ncbi:SpoIIE family protein phosphatase [Streptomyces sp. RS10V-4]|uniref:SpoIIE family protein phosphatase n=1 Tax=Streptomyces rhizoryzae TaxID=2932493 RepID=UPI00200542A2|nr:SpoIIE family protein phosphatase [Streptomyces rhizoryzae]MCK7627876.1 SpoIIE family protein phosphatase [Streptomyces rhizoryzae]